MEAGRRAILAVGVIGIKDCGTDVHGRWGCRMFGGIWPGVGLAVLAVLGVFELSGYGRARLDTATKRGWVPRASAWGPQPWAGFWAPVGPGISFAGQKGAVMPPWLGYGGQAARGKWNWWQCGGARRRLEFENLRFQISNVFG